MSEAASYACIIAAVFVPPFVPFAPLALYDIARRVRRERIWPALAIGAVFVCALVADLRGGVLTTRTLLLTAILSVAATLLSLRTAQLEREQRRMRRTRDELQERALALEARNRDLADRQDYEVELATLAERARIAREIHDNVGHQLTRASLQAEALRVVHADEPGVAADFADVKRTVDEALQLVRTSVHALNDNAVDLSVQLERIVEGTRSDGDPQIELEVMAEHAPANVANCFAAVLREALSNTMRHACAQTVTVRCMEHPSFYQLIVTDDGVGEVQASGRGTAEGMGLAPCASASRRLAAPSPPARVPAPAAGVCLPPFPNSKEMRPMRLIVVDDDRLVVDSLKIILGAQPQIEVVGTGANGNDAVALYAEHAPDIALLDIQMPGRDGLSAAREILEHDPAARVVFLTTFSDDEYIVSALKLAPAAT